MNIDPKQFEQLRRAAADDRHADFERLVEQIVLQAIRERRAKSQAGRPARPWLPQQV